MNKILVPSPTPRPYPALAAQLRVAVHWARQLSTTTHCRCSVLTEAPHGFHRCGRPLYGPRFDRPDEKGRLLVVRLRSSRASINASTAGRTPTERICSRNDMRVKTFVRRRYRIARHCQPPGPCSQSFRGLQSVQQFVGTPTVPE